MHNETMVFLVASSFIVIWCIVFSFIWSQWCYFFKKKGSRQALHFYFPSLVIAPLTLIFGMKYFQLNLIFPLYLTSTPMERFIYSIPPGFILFYTSGLMFRIKSCIFSQYLFWKDKPFILFAKSMGRHSHKELKSIVIRTALVDAFQKCLAFLMGELLVIEVMFNAQGVGYELWNFAIMRQMEQVYLFLAGILFLYGLITFLLISMKKSLGKKLESYG